MPRFTMRRALPLALFLACGRPLDLPEPSVHADLAGRIDQASPPAQGDLAAAGDAALCVAPCPVNAPTVGDACCAPPSSDGACHYVFDNCVDDCVCRATGWACGCLD